MSVKSVLKLYYYVVKGDEVILKAVDYQITGFGRPFFHNFIYQNDSRKLFERNLNATAANKLIMIFLAATFRLYYPKPYYSIRYVGKAYMFNCLE